MFKVVFNLKFHNSGAASSVTHYSFLIRNTGSSPEAEQNITFYEQKNQFYRKYSLFPMLFLSFSQIAGNINISHVIDFTEFFFFFVIIPMSDTE